MTNKTPVNVLTGFLGAGKTTLLNRLLRNSALASSAVLINEFGEVGLDHHLIERVDGDVVLMKSGCICCAVRGDISKSIRDLLARRDAGSISQFDRIIIETTGLADPVPVLATVMHDPVLQHHVRCGHVLTVVDAVHGLQQISVEPESRRQAAVADSLILTKTDLPFGQVHLPVLLETLQSLNPLAQVIDLQSRPFSPEQLLGDDVFSPNSKSKEALRWLNAAINQRYFPVHSGTASVHRDITSFVVRLPEALDWTIFCIWLSSLVHRHGDSILRIKGILHVTDASAPIAVHVVQRLIHAPEHLDKISDREESVLVFIVKGLEAEKMRSSLSAMRALLST